MVIELALIFFVTTHLRHLFQRIEHSLDDSVICSVDRLSDLQRIGANELRLDATDVRREVLDERCNTFPLLAGEFRLFDGLDLIVLKADDFRQST